MQRIEKVVAGVGLTLAACAFVVHVSGAGSWMFQMSVYRGAAPVLSGVSAWLFWRSFVRTDRPGVRGYALLTGAGLALLTLAQAHGLGQLIATGDLSYPGTALFSQIASLLSVICGVAALLVVPVRARWWTSRLRVGLDMLTVLAGGAVFLWYFVVQPQIDPERGAVRPVLALVQALGALIMLFAVARLALGGVAEVSRRALALSAAVVVTDVLLQTFKQLADGHTQVLIAVAGWSVLAGLLICVGVALLQSSTSGPAPAAPADTRRRVSKLPYVAVLASYVLLVAGLRADGLTARTWVVLAGVILLTGLVVARQVIALRDNARLLTELDDSLHAVRRAVARERILGELGTALLTTTDQGEVHRLAVDAATGLLAECPGARATLVAVSAEDPDNFHVVSVAGPGADERIGGRLPASAVPIELLVTLARGEVVSGSSLSALGVTGFGAPLERPLIVMPLLNGERFFGVLVVSADGDLPDDLRKSLNALRTQLSLALDSAALTAELTTRALHDSLTGLGNRALLRDRMAGALARSRRHGRPMGALLLDLNGFKQVNDVHGHDAGDDLLKVVADRLRACVRTEDTVCRLGGDEFVVIAEDLHSASDAVVIAERIVAALDEVVPVGRHLVRTPASIGIALSHVDVPNPDELLRMADAAMYRAKASGGGYHLHGAGETALVSTE